MATARVLRLLSVYALENRIGKSRHHVGQPLVDPDRLRWSWFTNIAALLFWCGSLPVKPSPQPAGRFADGLIGQTATPNQWAEPWCGSIACNKRKPVLVALVWAGFRPQVLLVRAHAVRSHRAAAAPLAPCSVPRNGCPENPRDCHGAIQAAPACQLGYRPSQTNGASHRQP